MFKKKSVHQHKTTCGKYRQLMKIKVCCVFFRLIEESLFFSAKGLTTSHRSTTKLLQTWRQTKQQMKQGLRGAVDVWEMSVVTVNVWEMSLLILFNHSKTHGNSSHTHTTFSQPLLEGNWTETKLRQTHVRFKSENGGSRQESQKRRQDHHRHDDRHEVLLLSRRLVPTTQPNQEASNPNYLFLFKFCEKSRDEAVLLLTCSLWLTVPSSQSLSSFCKKYVCAFRQSECNLNKILSQQAFLEDTLTEKKEIESTCEEET